MFDKYWFVWELQSLLRAAKALSAVKWWRQRVCVRSRIGSIRTMKVRFIKKKQDAKRNENVIFLLLLFPCCRRDQSSQQYQRHAQRATWDWNQLQSSQHQIVAQADRGEWTKGEGKQEAYRNLIFSLWKLIIFHIDIYFCLQKTKIEKFTRTHLEFTKKNIAALR